jgi:hypothetical protein
VKRYHNSCTGSLGRPFSTCSQDLFVSLMKLLAGNSKTSSLGTTLHKCQIIRISELLDVGLMEFWLQTV